MSKNAVAIDAGALSSPSAAAAPSPVAPAGEARIARQQAAAAVRRSAVLDAARSAFLELGLEGASLREIARRAGYTPGALYSYFDSKEAVYAALLGESLDRLNDFVGAAAVAVPARDACADTGSRSRSRRAAQASVRAKAQAFFDFYLAHPRDLDLGFYLSHGLQPRGLTPALDERLNARLFEALQPVRDGLQALGVDAAEAQAETTALFAQAAGLLLLAHTGRIRMFGQRPEALYADYLDALLDRAGCAGRKAARVPRAASGSRRGAA